MKILIVEDDKEMCDIYEEEIAGYNEESKEKIDYIIKQTKEDGLKAIDEENFDAAIVDLNLGPEEELSGNEIVKKIFKEKRIPIYIVSGTPTAYQKIEELEGKEFLLKILTRGEKEIIDILNELVNIYNTGLTKILNRQGILDKIMDEIFLKYSEKLIKNLQENNEIETSEKEKIMSRFCASIINEKLKYLTPKYHPCEIYYTPPLKEDITTGDILVEKESNKKNIVLTPACDLEKRENGKRKVETVLIARIESLDEIFEHNNPTGKSKKKILEKLKEKRYKSYYEYLPIDNDNGQAINFCILSCVEIKDIEEKYHRESSLNETFLKEIIFNFSKHYGRQGIPEFH